MSNFLLDLMSRYHAELDNRKDYEHWRRCHPGEPSWKYPRDLPNNAKLKRLGIMIRKEMIRMEKQGRRF